MKTKIDAPAILTFYMVAIALRYLTNKTGLLDGVSSDFLKVVLQGISPAIAAMAAFYIFKIKPTLNLKGNYSKTSTPFLLYWALPVVLISGAAYFIKGTIAPVTVISILFYGLLEEIGWRGFLQRELKPLPEFLNILLVATLWFIWHLNFDLTSSNLLFFAILILGSWGIGKVADSTHSLLAVSAFHSLNNFFPAMDTIKTILLITLLLIWVISLLIRKRQLNKKPGQSLAMM
ncbi:CPBP family intramembrane glutamic endopeptidase [Pedobacter sp. CFBP9032]|uniref:CPBP family intramembrane glutamic endopeptidase n=1 Tax=Pedobacter sp. CFBP9032 TaxID=3096539 RepID=UPI002A6A08C2|nr:CPBP family intramembrane glutamic endopeptidase [Pedobacter sp. CFBP9032]MDY0904765.1 CPBP family intramembrane glutamic endopeptidase [Pedobacter sp. CFBP9032]